MLRCQRIDPYGCQARDHRFPMNNRILTALLILSGLAVGCTEDPLPPPTVPELMENKILLDATMVRCSRNRAEMKYQAECVNAREAANTLARDAEAERRNLLEQQSERKRAALRRAQEAADQARRRAEEAARLRAEADYLAQFGAEPGAGVEGAGALAGDDASGVPEDGGPQPAATDAVPSSRPEPEAPADLAPAADAPAGPPADSDLEAIREELERRRQAADPR